jgi:hypothetical protein
VVAERAGPALRVAVGHRLPGQVELVDVAEDQPHPGQDLGQRHADPARLQDAGRDLGQQRQVEEVVGGVDQDDVGAAAGQPGEPAGRRETGEAGADDHDPGTCHAVPSLRAPTAPIEDRVPHRRYRKRPADVPLTVRRKPERAESMSAANR